MSYRWVPFFIAALLAALASVASADISINSSGVTIGSPTFRSYQPNGVAHVQALTVCDRTTTDRCITVDANGATTTVITGALPAGNNVIGHVICDSGCSSSSSPSYGAAFPATGTPIGFTDGTNMVPGRVRTGLIGASDNGIVVRPFMPSDGTNTMPVGDSSARSIHVTVDNGSATVTENGNLTLGTSAVAETVALGYGAVVLTPSTMTLGTNGNGMRRTVAAAGQTIVQLNSPIGDWKKGKATATGTSDTSLVSALGSGIKFCMTDWAVSNSSATDTTIRFRDDVGGSPADLTEAISVPNKGGNQGRLATPICSSANKAFGFKADTGVTTVAVTVSGYATKE